MGSDADFHGRAAYFLRHGHYTILDTVSLKEAGRLDEDYNEWWGFEDEKLFAYAKEEGKRRLLLQTIGFSRNTFAFLSSLPLFVVAVLESGISLILYFCLKGSLENSIATIFSSSLYAYLPSTPWLLVPILFALLLPFLFAYGKIRFSRKPLAMQIKAIKE